MNINCGLFFKDMTWKPKHIKVTKANKHVPLLKEAYEFAWKHSDDKSTKTGAVIVTPNLNQILAYGTNCFPPGVVMSEERFLSPLKYKFIEHAERDAIYSAAKQGIKLEGSTMYMPWSPCHDCARAIIESGIEELVGHKSMIMKTPQDWQGSIDDASEMLHEAGIRLFMYDGKLGGVKGLFRYEEWSP
jgi:dCMP deaminase